MSDDRRFLMDVARGQLADPCSYRCRVDGCPKSTGYQADKTATGMVRDGMGRFVCALHADRPCLYCKAPTPWFDGGVCDFCDRYTDEDG